MRSFRPFLSYVHILGVLLGLMPSFILGQDISLELVLEEADHKGLGNARIHRMLDFAEQLDLPGIEAALDRVLAANHGGQKYELIQMLYARWAELDIDAAVSHATSQSGNAQYVALGAIIPIWAVRDSMAAWEWFEKEGDGLPRHVTGIAILLEVARKNPEKALAMYKESKVFGRSSNPEESAFIYIFWAGRSPAAAIAKLKEEESYGLRDRAVSTIATQWFDQDPDAAWEWVKGLSRNDERTKAIKMILSQLALRDIEKAKQLIKEFPSESGRKMAIEAVLEGLVLADPAAAYEFAQENLSVAGNPSRFSQILTHWARKDPAQAFEVAQKELNPGRARKIALEGIIQSVSNQNVDLAIKMLEELGVDSNYPLAAGSVGRGIAMNDLKRAVSWAESLPEGNMKQSAISAVISEWVRESPVDAMNYARAAEGDELLRRAFSRWSYQNPKDAVFWAHEQLKPKVKRLLLPDAIAQWGDKDLKAASDWVDALPAAPAEAEDLRNACIGRLSYSWVTYDPVGGGKWLKNLKPGVAKDQALANFSNRSFDSNPKAALKWANEIGDSAKRSRAIEQLARRYLSIQPENARKWIQSSSLSDEKKNDLLGKKR